MGLLALLIQECLFFLGYVTGSQQYPKPLTRREEAKLLAEMAEGSEEARRELILHNLRLVAHIARKYTVPGHNAEDLTSIGVVGLIKAVGSYRCGGGTSLGTYAARCIENAILSQRNKLDLEAKTSHHVAKNGAYSVTYADTGMS